MFRSIKVVKASEGGDLQWLSWSNFGQRNLMFKLKGEVTENDLMKILK